MDSEGSKSGKGGKEFSLHIKGRGMGSDKKKGCGRKKGSVMEEEGGGGRLTLRKGEEKRRKKRKRKI